MEKYQDTITIFISIFVEALPFILIGTAIATYVKFYVKTEAILKILPKNKLGKCIYLSSLGIFFPVCECGNVPVMKGLIEKKIPPFATISFLLGAPILNPIVITTTIVAFPDRPEIWIARILIALFISVAVGYLFSFSKTEEIIKQLPDTSKCCSGSHDKKLKSLDHFSAECCTMLSIIAVGAAIAAISQTIIPRATLIELGSNPLTAILVMMILAFIISICSTTDAFFALAYSHIFQAPAIVAFLVFGPMIDLKILLLLKNILKTKAIIYLTILTTLLTIASTYAWHKLLI
jgi:uncharacterized membrane protein YraQ (UPF0718 family)